MGEQRDKTLLLTVVLTFVAVELNLRESGTCFPRKWSSALEIYKIIRGTEGNILCLKNMISK